MTVRILCGDIPVAIVRAVVDAYAEGGWLFLALADGNYRREWISPRLHIDVRSQEADR